MHKQFYNIEIDFYETKIVSVPTRLKSIKEIGSVDTTLNLHYFIL